eukprot:2555700-Prorocentrum_lima.AAC.1
MTSSLVGSEMCIRDRCNAMMSFANGHKDLLKWRVVLHFPTTPPISTVAVSYTHLTLPTICSV